MGSRPEYEERVEMILGILSDSHGQADRTARAVEALREQGATALVHCGDVCGVAVLDALAGATPAWFVWGNCDLPEPGDERYAQTLGLHVPETIPTVLEFAGKRLAVFHGHERAFERLYYTLLATDANWNDAGGASEQNGQYDYVLHGHTHEPRDVTVAGTRIINPGALQRAPIYTIATLDLTANQVQHWALHEDGGHTPIQIAGG